MSDIKTKAQLIKINDELYDEIHALEAQVIKFKERVEYQSAVISIHNDYRRTIEIVAKNK